MSEQTIGPQPTPRPASATPQLQGEEAIIPLTPEGSPKPPLPESSEILLESAEPNVVKDGPSAVEAAAAEAEAPVPSAPPPQTGFDLHAFTAEHQAQLEKLSMNLARAALAAQGAIAEVALKQADRSAALSPDPFHVAPALSDVMGRLAAEPNRLLRAQGDLFSRYMDLWQATVRKMTGEEAQPVVTPAKSDKRFADPDWQEHPVFDVIKQSYLLTSNWLNELV